MERLALILDALVQVARIQVARRRGSAMILAFLVAMGCAGMSASAQPAAAPAAGAPSAPPAADAPRQPDVSKQPDASKQSEASNPPATPPTPEHIAKARQLILATGISRSFEIIVPEFMDQIGNTLTQARPDLVHDMILVLEELKPEFEKQSDEMIDLSAKIYATLLSEKDLDAILAFYDSDAGKKYVAAQSLYINQLIPGSQAWQQKIAINMMARVRQEMKKKGHDL